MYPKKATKRHLKHLELKKINPKPIYFENLTESKYDLKLKNREYLMRKQPNEDAIYEIDLSIKNEDNLDLSEPIKSIESIIDQDKIIIRKISK